MATPPLVRPAVLDGPDALGVSALLADYHSQTESEKSAHGLAEAGDLPQRYSAEVRDPAAALAHGEILVAEQEGELVGMVVLHRTGDDVEIKRLWVAAAHRRSGVGGALMADVVTRSAAKGAAGLRLSVWDWRVAAVELYRTQGFVDAPSWESRERLVCLRRPCPAGSARDDRSA
ncbi:GNAT family N-acetyltransferase [Janibacter melonis]|uniref:GNAT family N-acetyltransferase n=1 Tax=Janibacter melonis TaxID=262209 RepID=UPI001E6520F3|nr:GNAT family N-acetyltransferase [Janibacter melonis]MCB5992375.1 GNAT family N-acetyltransferase [Janibacter melonis]